MRDFLRRLGACYAGGTLGGLINSLAVWMAGQYGWAAAMGVAIAPELTPAWLYPRLVWGGLWGLLYFPAFLSDSIFWRGLFFSFAPTAVQLFIIFPVKLQKGVWGLELGQLTPLYVVMANALWGWITALWVRAADGGSRASRGLR